MFTRQSVVTKRLSKQQTTTYICQPFIFTNMSDIGKQLNAYWTDCEEVSFSCSYPNVKDIAKKVSNVFYILIYATERHPFPICPNIVCLY